MLKLLEITTAPKKAYENVQGGGGSSKKVHSVILSQSKYTYLFYKKLRTGGGRQFLKFSGHFATRSFLHVS